ncbi:MBL fold metallo-hydrolase [Candidatus Soleaferrea massiliensis]|uniref:MBL fold metallo-hydrolase n=1 Tax=Candidatus Soleaferrea massiliensis TaxID=1470354 RepID=UPI00058B471F|nr:MBL fold metallo-hydrolase [Candidatus Soleaferrea massiliensis]
MNIFTLPVGSLMSNCHIVATRLNSAVIIDPGAEAEKIISTLERNHLQPKYILLTHAHYDHIGAVEALQQRYPQIQTAIGGQDYDMLMNNEKNLMYRETGSMENNIRVDRQLKDGDTVTVDELSFHAIETPGHTAGGVTYLCETALFTGDTLFRGDIGRTDLYSGNYGEMMASLLKLKKLPGDYHVYPGHGPASTLDRERRYNPYIYRES